MVGAIFIADSIYGVYVVGREFIPTCEKVKKFIDVFEEYEKKLPAFKEAFKKKDDKALAKLRKQFLKSMKEGAKNNACLAARKCMLVPYEGKQTKYLSGSKNKQANPNAQPIEKTSKELPTTISQKRIAGEKYGLCGSFGLASTAGCCPGQTGHHVIPDSWGKQKGSCPEYDKDDAPAVCTEGVTRNGSHGEFHDGLDEEVKDHREKNGEAALVDIKGAIKMATDGHHRGMNLIFNDEIDGEEEFCTKDCITAQLEHYYEGKCEGKIKPLKGAGSLKKVKATLSSK